VVFQHDAYSTAQEKIAQPRLWSNYLYVDFFKKYRQHLVRVIKNIFLQNFMFYFRYLLIAIDQRKTLHAIYAISIIKICMMFLINPDDNPKKDMTISR